MSTNCCTQQFFAIGSMFRNSPCRGLNEQCAQDHLWISLNTCYFLLLSMYSWWPSCLSIWLELNSNIRLMWEKCHNYSLINTIIARWPFVLLYWLWGGNLQSSEQVINVTMICGSWVIWNVSCLPVEHVQSAWTKAFSVDKTTPFFTSGSMNYCSASANEIVLDMFVRAYRHYLTTGSDFTCAVYC